MKYEPVKISEEILAFWEKKRIYEKLKKSLKNKPIFFHLDGPPYPTGDPHPGTSWNRCLKDMLRRIKRMQGYNVWDQPGFDMHGLPTESKVEKAFNLRNKKEIEEFGVNKFIKECWKSALKYLDICMETFKKLGEWATWDDPYLTLHNSYIESVWWALKETWKKKLLYQGKKVMHWCYRCGTALACNYEVNYKKTSDNSIYVKFHIVGKKDEYLIIWTTTPWTLPCNMAVMVHPDFDYVKISVDNEKWILAKELVNSVMANIDKDYKIVEELKGKGLEGIKYEQPFKKEVLYHQKQKAKNAYSVVLSKDYVDLSAGSGLVHCAPGCGAEDYDVGLKYKIPAFNPADEHGVFGEQAGRYSGWRTKEDDPKYTEELRKKGLVIFETRIEHEYPFCERCKTPVIFRATEQWFLKVTKIKNKMVKLNEKVRWVPLWAGKNQFRKWLENIRDWCVTRQRYFGIPFPLWRCNKCKNMEFIGSAIELKKKAGKVPKDLHPPPINDVTWKCKCGGIMKRHPDVIDVWIDASSAPFASLGYPHKNKEIFKKLSQTDFITESKDQIRGWFYGLMGMGVLVFDKCPLTNVYMHGYMCDEKGTAMSKRKGNYEPTSKILSEVGADVFRLYVLGCSQPGIDVNYNKKEVTETYKALNVLWNLHEFLIRYSRFSKYKPSKKLVLKNIEDKWIVSRINTVTKECTEFAEKFYLNNIPLTLTDFFLEDFSRWYIKLIRERVSAGTNEEKKEVVNVIHYVLAKLLKLLAPVIPFAAEKIYQNLRKEYDLKKESIHFYSWPTINKIINKKLEENMVLIKRIVQATLSAREKANIGLRWPLRRAIVVSEKLKKEKLKDFERILLGQTNVKRFDFIAKKPFETEPEIKINYVKVSKKYGEEKTAKIIVKAASLSYNTIKNSLDKKEKLELKLDSEEVINLIPEDFIFSERTPEGITSGSFKDGTVYLEMIMDEKLLSEGYSRELTRCIQEMRKRLGLKKGDFVETVVFASERLTKFIEPHIERIKNVTGSRKLEISIEDKTKESKLSNEFKIKDELIRIGVTQI